MSSPNQQPNQNQNQAGNMLSNAMGNMLNLPATQQSVLQKYQNLVQILQSASQQVNQIQGALSGSVTPSTPLGVATQVAMTSGASGQIAGAYAMAAALQARANQAPASSSANAGPVMVQFTGEPLRVIIVGNEAEGWLDKLNPVGFAAAGGAFLGNLVGGVAGAFVNPLAYIKMFDAGTDFLKSMERLVPQFYSLMDGPISSLFDQVLAGAQHVQNFLDSTMGYVGWIISGLGTSGWITQSIFGFFDAALLWVTSRVKALLGWAAQSLVVINNWLFPTISVMVGNLMNSVLDSIITNLAARLVNFIHRAIAEVWAGIRGLQAGMSAFGTWVGGLFANIMARLHNAIADGVNAVAGPINQLGRAISYFKGTPLFQVNLMQQQTVPQVAPFNFATAVAQGHSQGLNEARQHFPWNHTSQTVQNSWAGSWIQPQPLQSPPPMGRLPNLNLPGLTLPGPVQPGTGEGGGGSGCCGVTVQGGIHVTVQAGSVSADSLNALARQLADRMMEELERVGNMRLSRQGRPLLATQ